MPHFIIDCSHSLLEKHNAKEIMDCVYHSAQSQELFAATGAGGVKVRIQAFEHYLTSDLESDFVHVFAHIMSGRNEAQKKSLSQKVLSNLQELLPELPVLSINIIDIDKSSYVNKALLES